MLILWSGSYRRLEWITTTIVVTVTLLTVLATAALAWTDYPIRWNEVAAGMNPLNMTTDLPVLRWLSAFLESPASEQQNSSTIHIGVWRKDMLVTSASMMAVKLGNACSRLDSRHVFRCWTSMIVFTVSTISFYLWGASVLHPQNLFLRKKEMIATLSRMFVDSIGPWTQSLFLLGALRGTLQNTLLSCAGNARMTADFIGLNKANVYRNERRSLALDSSIDACVSCTGPWCFA